MFFELYGSRFRYQNGSFDPFSSMSHVVGVTGWPVFWPNQLINDMDFYDMWLFIYFHIYFYICIFTNIYIYTVFIYIYLYMMNICLILQQRLNSWNLQKWLNSFACNAGNTTFCKNLSARQESDSSRVHQHTIKLPGPWWQWRMGSRSLTQCWCFGSLNGEHETAS